MSSHTDTIRAYIALEDVSAADAEAALDALEAELAKYEQPGWINPVQKVVLLQAELARKTEALRYINDGDYGGATSVAAAALAEPTGEEK